MVADMRSVGGAAGDFISALPSKAPSGQTNSNAARMRSMVCPSLV
jgi:hypothetical protein